MTSNEAVIDTGLDFDGELLRREGTNERRRSERSARVATGGLGTSDRSRSGGDEEQSPLLDQSSSQGSEEEEVSEFAHLPWHKRPSIYWMIGPFFIVACAYGGMMAPKIDLITQLTCREYYAEKMLREPGFIMVQIDYDGGSNDQCRVDAVTSRVSSFTGVASLVVGLLAAIVSPKLGALSDRYGRRPLLAITSLGTISGEIVTSFAATYPETFPIWLLLLSYACDGLTGSFISSMTISTAYASDCTPPSQRPVAFAFFQSCLFMGVAIGPILAGYLVKWSGRIATVFYTLTAVYSVFVLFLLLVVPESLSPKKKALAREKHRQSVIELRMKSGNISKLHAINILEPLRILYPTGLGSSAALRMNLVILAAIDTIVFGVAMGTMQVIIIYLGHQFGWQSLEVGRFMTITASCRVFCLVVVLPALTRLVKGKLPAGALDTGRGSDRFELAILRFAIAFDTLGYVGYAFSPTGALFILSGVIAAIGGIASPTLQSSLTKHIPPDRVGQLLGAIGLLHALARVVAPVVFSAIFSVTVGKYTPTVFVCLVATFGVAFCLSWFLRTGLFLDETVPRLDRPGDEDEGATEAPYRDRGDDRTVVNGLSPTVSYAEAPAVGVSSRVRPKSLHSD